MADAKITELVTLATPADGDLLPIVDVSDTTQAASGSTKQIAKSDLFNGYVTATDLAATARAYSAAQYHATEVLTYASTVDWDVQASPNAELTLTGAATLDASNLADGVTGYLFIRQDGTGGRVLTFGAAFSGTDGTLPTVATGASELTVIPYVVEGGAVILPSDPAGGDAGTLGGLDVGTLADPDADRLFFWDDSEGEFALLTVGTGLSLTGTTLTASGGGGSGAMPEVVFRAKAADFPATNYATHDTRNNHAVLDFDAATEETCYFTGVLPSSYAGGGLTVKVVGMATSATTGNVVLGVSIERLNTDLDSDSFATEATQTVAVNGTSGIPFTGTFTLADGSAMDSLAAGEPFRLRVARKAADGSDTATGDFELTLVVVGETP